MSDKIKAALSPEQWAWIDAAEPWSREERLRSIIHLCTSDEHGNAESFGSDAAPEIIAAANSLLPDSDLRKITREWVERLRKWADDADAATYDRLQLDPAEAREMAVALESYLPPESR